MDLDVSSASWSVTKASVPAEAINESCLALKNCCLTKVWMCFQDGLDSAAATVTTSG